MKGKQKLNILLGTIIFAIIVLVTNKSNAGLQSNGDTPATKNINDWMLEVRKMQTSGGTLGLSDTINESNLTSNNTNLDIHMEKNTEFGAMALLSASAYGKPDKINDGETTTGNKSGIYININKEWVAAGTLSLCSQYVNAKSRYKNLYTLPYVAKKGDAINETIKWHGSESFVWLSGASVNSYSGLLRAYAGSIFSYYGYGVNGSYFDAYYQKNWATRAIIVNGSNV